MKPGFVYIMGNTNHTTLYIGVTANLVQRIWQHKEKLNSHSFTSKYNIHRLYYYQYFEDISFAIQEEKRLKGGSRKDKEELILSVNPQWDDLYDEIASSPQTCSSQ